MAKRPSVLDQVGMGKRRSSAAIFGDTESSSAEDKKKYQMMVNLRFGIIITLLFVIILTLLDVIPLMDAVGEKLVKSIRDMGVGGGFLYSLLCVGMVIICVPVSLLSLAAGYTWESTGYGFMAAWPGLVTGCCVAFYVGRILFKDWLEMEMRHNLKFAALSQATDEHGAKVVFFACISPLPSSMVNYAFSISAINIKQFSAAISVGLVPIVAGYAKVGSVFYTFFETDELQKAIEACKKNDALKTCCDRLVAGTSTAEISGAASASCAVMEMYMKTTCAQNPVKAFKTVAQCLVDVSGCSWSAIDKEAGDLNCRYNDADCGGASDANTNSCLKDLNNSELWPLIVAPLALFFTFAVCGYFGHRALQRAGLLQVSYDLDRQRELLAAERDAELKEMASSEV